MLGRRVQTILVAVVALAFAAAAKPPRPENRSVGPVEVRSAVETWRPVRAGEALALGGALRTGAGGRAEVVLPAGTVRVFERSELRLPSDGDGARLELARGTAIFDIRHRDVTGPFEV